jgi:hypothetical protein
MVSGAEAAFEKMPGFSQPPATAPRLLSLLTDEGTSMMVATGLAIFVVICLLLSIIETPPAIGK